MALRQVLAAVACLDLCLPKSDAVGCRVHNLAEHPRMSCGCCYGKVGHHPPPHKTVLALALLSRFCSFIYLYLWHSKIRDCFHQCGTPRAREMAWWIRALAVRRWGPEFKSPVSTWKARHSCAHQQPQHCGGWRQKGYCGLLAASLALQSVPVSRI